jgi:hypothetical protein
LSLYSSLNINRMSVKGLNRNWFMMAVRFMRRVYARRPLYAPVYAKQYVGDSAFYLDGCRSPPFLPNLSTLLQWIDSCLAPMKLCSIINLTGVFTQFALEEDIGQERSLLWFSL